MRWPLSVLPASLLPNLFGRTSRPSYRIWGGHAAYGRGSGVTHRGAKLMQDIRTKDTLVLPLESPAAFALCSSVCLGPGHESRWRPSPGVRRLLSMGKGGEAAGNWTLLERGWASGLWVLGLDAVLPSLGGPLCSGWSRDPGGSESGTPSWEVNQPQELIWPTWPQLGLRAPRGPPGSLSPDGGPEPWPALSARAPLHPWLATVDGDVPVTTGGSP